MLKQVCWVGFFSEQSNIDQRFLKYDWNLEYLPAGRQVLINVRAFIMA